MPSVINYVLRKARDDTLATRLSHCKKIEKLADRQDRPLGPRKDTQKSNKGTR